MDTSDNANHQNSDANQGVKTSHQKILHEGKYTLAINMALDVRSLQRIWRELTETNAAGTCAK